MSSSGNVQSFYYFSFGSNLLTERIHIQIKKAQFVSIGRLKNYELQFYDYGHRWRGAVASIEYSKNSEVWGCLWKVPHSFAKELDIQESGYHRLDVYVETEESIILCRTYQYSNPQRQRQHPSPHYKHVIICGAIEHQLPAKYIEYLTKIPHNGYKGEVDLTLSALKNLNLNDQ